MDTTGPRLHQPAQAASPSRSAALQRTCSGLSAGASPATYRVLSAGQDAQLAVWDFVVSDDFLALRSVLCAGSLLPHFQVTDCCVSCKP